MLVLTRDPHEFAARAQPFLEGRLDRNVMATLLINARDGRYRSSPPLFGYLHEGGVVLAAALRIPPWSLLCTELDPAQARELVQLWLLEDPDISGVNGLPGTARAVVAAWSAITGGSTRLALAEAMHECGEVRDPARPAAGELRVATAADRALLVDWSHAFHVEALSGRAGQSESMVDARLDRDGLLLWDDGEPTCMVGLTPPVAGVIRVGPVYTPPAQRRRGYAGSATAAATRVGFTRGASRCMLYTDLANPTSNKIYAEIGYTRVGEWEDHEFTPAGG